MNRQELLEKWPRSNLHFSKEKDLLLMLYHHSTNGYSIILAHRTFSYNSKRWKITERRVISKTYAANLYVFSQSHKYKATTLVLPVEYTYHGTEYFAIFYAEEIK